MKSLLLWLWIAQGADISTTAVALQRGCVERTYWSARPATIAAGKIAGSVVITFGARRSNVGKGLAVAFAGAATTAAVLNARTMGSCR